MITGNPIFLNSFLSSMLAAGGLNTAGQCTLKVYDGAIPSDAASLNFNAANFTSQLVGTFTNLTLQVVGSALILNQVPSSIAAARAANPIVWGALIGQNNVGLILQAGLSGGTGSVILNTLTPASGGTLTLVDTGIRIVFYQ